MNAITLGISLRISLSQCSIILLTFRCYSLVFTSRFCRSSADLVDGDACFDFKYASPAIFMVRLNIKSDSAMPACIAQFHSLTCSDAASICVCAWQQRLQSPMQSLYLQNMTIFQFHILSPPITSALIFFDSIFIEFIFIVIANLNSPLVEQKRNSLQWNRITCFFFLRKSLQLMLIEDALFNWSTNLALIHQ